MSGASGLVFDVDTFAIHDGPGIRLTVFFKGCPLRCAWCHSPESQKRTPEPAHVAEQCALCGACAEACPENAIYIESGERGFRSERCVGCGACAVACEAGALSIKGYPAESDDIIATAVRMKPFFDHSDGGVTLTGGEATQQPDFATAVLMGCRDNGVHTIVETCGACSWRVLKETADTADTIYYDIKLIDERQHAKWTGSSNRRILENAIRLGQISSHIDTGRDRPALKDVVRVPLIPGVTDTDDNIRDILSFIREANLRTVEFLPYNTSAGAKYEWLSREFTLGENTRANDEALARARDLAKASGVAVISIE